MSSRVRGWKQNPTGPFDRIFVSPAVHQIHHSYAPQHWDKNLGGMFSIWDWMAGTLYLPRERETPPLGLYGEEHREYNSNQSASR